jgi:target of rapamycin complex 2 subunit MAPKAP1
MYFADIIALLIRRKHLTPSDPREWVLLLGDASMALPLDRTVESLMGAADLALVRRSWAESHGLVAKGKEGEMRGGNPNSELRRT